MGHKIKLLKHKQRVNVYTINTVTINILHLAHIT